MIIITGGGEAGGFRDDRESVPAVPSAAARIQTRAADLGLVTTTTSLGATGSGLGEGNPSLSGIGPSGTNPEENGNGSDTFPILGAARAQATLVPLGTENPTHCVRSGPPTLPKALGDGSTIAVIAIAQTLRGDDVNATRQFFGRLRQEGFIVQHSRVYGPQDGTPELVHGHTNVDGIAQEVNAAIRDHNVHAIFLAKGRGASGFLLDQMDFDELAVNRPVVAGSGKATGILNAIYQRTGLVTFLACEPRTGDISSYMSSRTAMPYLRTRLCLGDPQVLKLDSKLWRPSAGTVQGRLLGGDLAETLDLIGTEFWPCLKGAILLVESTRLDTPQVEAAFWRLRKLGGLDGVKAILIGHVGNATEGVSFFKHFKATVARAVPDSIPVLSTEAFGHAKSPLYLPIGAEVELDTGNGLMRLPTVVLRSVSD